MVSCTAPSTWRRENRLLAMAILSGSYFLVELIVGHTSNCLALVSDAFHVLSDFVALLLAWGAIRLSKRPSDARFTFGWQRAELLGALINSVFLLALCFSVTVEAISRFFEPQSIRQPEVLLATATFGLFINIIGLLIFHEHGHTGCTHGHSHSHNHSHNHSHSHSHSHNHNHSHAVAVDTLEVGLTDGELAACTYKLESTVLEEQDDSESCSSELSHLQRSALREVQAANGRKPIVIEGNDTNLRAVFLHILTDALASVAVIAGTLVMWLCESWTSRWVVDPILSLLIVLMMIPATVKLVRAVSLVMLQAAPGFVEMDKLQKDLVAIDGVCGVADLRVWQSTDTTAVGTCIILVSVEAAACATILREAVEVFAFHGVGHATVMPQWSETRQVTPRLPPLEKPGLPVL